MSDYYAYISGDCTNIDGGRSLQEGGAVGMKKLFDWSPKQWDQFKEQLAQ